MMQVRFVHLMNSMTGKMELNVRITETNSDVKNRLYPVHGLFIARLLITIPIIARIIYLTQPARVFHSRVGGMGQTTDVIGMMIIYLDVREQLMKWPVLLLIKDVFYNYYTR
jgi:hypothetical protein